MGKEYKVVGILHTHPYEKDMDCENFSSIDISQAQTIQNADNSTTVRSYLLTPDNWLLVYPPKENNEHPKGEKIGFFTKTGGLIVTNQKYKEFDPTKQ
jgi:hypothetical protein